MIQFLRNFFFHDWLLKLFSLTLAILTWLAVSFSLRQRVVPVPGPANVVEKTFYDLPVAVISENSDVSGFKVEPRELDVTLQGNERLLAQVPRNEVRVLVDLSDVVLKTAQQLPVQVVAPAGITYVRVKPDNLVKVSPQNLKTDRPSEKNQ